MLVVLQIICVLYKKVEKEYTRRVKKLIYKYVRLIIVEIFDGRDQKQYNLTKEQRTCNKDRH